MTARKKKPDPQAKEDFKADIRRWADRINVKPKRVQLQRMTKKWASCSPAGRLTFAVDLLEQPAAFRQAVIVHELLHLIVPNHGKLFKSMMGAYVSGWDRVLTSDPHEKGRS